MASMPWVKFYIDFLDDPKIGRLTDRQKLRFVQLILIAGECDMDGLLVNGDTALGIDDIAWRIRSDPKHVSEDIAALHDAGLIDPGDAINVVNFSKRQGRSQEERRAQWRESKRRIRESPARVQQESNESPIGVLPLEESREEKSREEESRERGATAPARATAPAVPPALKNQPRPPTKRQKAQRDFELQTHPAILAWRNVFPDNRLESFQVSAIIREVDDAVRWGEICAEWALKGHHATNVKDLLHVYRNGWRNGSNGKSEPGKKARRDMTPAERINEGLT